MGVVLPGGAKTVLTLLNLASITEPTSTSCHMEIRKHVQETETKRQEHIKPPHSPPPTFHPQNPQQFSFLFHLQSRKIKSHSLATASPHAKVGAGGAGGAGWARGGAPSSPLSALPRDVHSREDDGRGGRRRRKQTNEQLEIQICVQKTSEISIKICAYG